MSFILDTNTLGGNEFNYVESIFAERGRAVEIQWSQAGADEDLELYGYSIRFAPGEAQAQE